jgi:hypothetical protein
MPSGSVILISPDGKTQKRYPVDYAQKKLSEGWTTAGGQQVGIETEYGKHYVPAEQGVAEMGPTGQLGGASGISAETAQQDWIQEERRQEYEGRGAEAALAGAARGLTFGLSDVVLPGLGIAEKETLQGLKEFEPGMSMAGELGTILAGGVGSLGTGALAKGLRATPIGAVSAATAKYGKGSTARFLGANAAEGTLYGLGQGITQTALSDEELAAETAASDILKSGALGGIVGLGGAAAMRTGEKLWKAGKGLKAPKSPPHLDIKTPEGAEFLGSTANRLRETMDSADDMFVKTDPMTTRRLTDDEIYTFDMREKVVRNHIDDAISRGHARRTEIASKTFDIPPPPKGLDDIQVPVRVDPELPRGPEAPMAPVRDADEMAGRLAELEEELAAATSKKVTKRSDYEGTIPDTDFAGLPRDTPEGFDAMMRRRNAIESDKPMLAGHEERKMRDVAQVAREEFGRAAGGVDDAAIAARTPGAPGMSKYSGELRAPKDIEAEIAAITAETKGLPAEVKAYEKSLATYEKQAAAHAKKVEKILAKEEAKHARAMAKYEKDKLKLAGSQQDALAAYEKQVASIEEAIAYNRKTLEEFDGALETLSLRKKHFETRGASRGGQYEKHKVALQGDAVEIADDINAVRRMVGDSPADLKQFADDSRRHVQLGNEVTERLRRPLSEGAVEAREAYEVASKELREAMGDPTAQNLGKLMNAEPEEMIKGFNALAKYSKAMEGVAATSGDKALIKATKESLDAVKKHLDASLPPEAAAAAAGMEGVDIMTMLQAGGAGFAPVYNADGTIVDDLGKTALIYALLRKGKGLPMTGTRAPRQFGPKPSSTFAGRVATSGAAGTARAVMPAGGAMAKGSQYAVSTAAHQAFGGFLNKLGGARGLHQLSGRSTSQVVQAIDRLTKKTGKQLATGKSAAAVLKAMKFAEDAEQDAKDSEEDIRKLFEKRSHQLRRMAHDDNRLQMDLWSATADLRDLHPTWGDKTEVGLGNRLRYAMEKLPRDPGEHHMFGGTAWQPDDYQIQEYANIMRVVMDPMSAVEGVADGTLTPEAAEAFRATAPRTFAAVQAEIAGRVGELQETLTYDEQNRLSMLMGVPVNATTTPEYQNFISSTYAQRQAEQAQSMGKVDANALTQGVPTQAQQLLNRGNK